MQVPKRFQFIVWVWPLTVLLACFVPWGIINSNAQEANGFPDRDQLFASSEMDKGGHLHYYLVEEMEERSAGCAKPRLAPKSDAQRVASARLKFATKFPADPRAWLVASYLFIPPSYFDLSERVLYMRTVRSELRLTIADTTLKARTRTLLLVVDAFHELDKLKYAESAAEKWQFAELDEKRAALAAHDPDDHSLARLNGYIAGLLARKKRNEAGSDKSDSGTDSRENPLAARVAGSIVPSLRGNAPAIDSMQLEPVLRLQCPFPVAEMHTRAKDAEREGCGPWAVIMLQEQKDRDALRWLEEFFEKYPRDPRLAAVVKAYLFITPDFILAYPERSGDGRTWLEDFRSLPRDVAAKEHWLRTGDNMAKVLLASSKASQAEKQMVAVAQIFRDLRNRSYGWEPAPDVAEIISRYMNHVAQFGEVDAVADYIPNFLNMLRKLEPSEVGAYAQQLRNHPNPRIQRAVEKYLRDQVRDEKAPFSDRLLQLIFTSLQGEPIDLKEYRGKVVLIDFWATWCSPCVAEMPNLKAVYEKYRSQGFEVVGISGDSGSKEHVVEFLRNGGYGWPQHFDGQGTANYFAQLFDVRAWPTTYLIGKDGQVIEKNVRGARLEPAIRQALGLDPPKETSAEIKPEGHPG